MANMTFGVNILPNATDTLNLGNSSKKWNVYANTLNDKDVANIPTTSDFTATIPTTGWTEGTDIYSIAVTVSGLPNTGKGIIGLVQGNNEETNSELREAFGLITRAVMTTNTLTVYATEIPEVALPVQIGVFE